MKINRRERTADRHQVITRGSRAREQEYRDQGGKWWPRIPHLPMPAPRSRALMNGRGLTRDPAHGRQPYQERHETHFDEEAAEDWARAESYYEDWHEGDSFAMRCR